jgi:hypothetical protein
MCRSTYAERLETPDRDLTQRTTAEARHARNDSYHKRIQQYSAWPVHLPSMGECKMAEYLDRLPPGRLALDVLSADEDEG